MRELEEIPMPDKKHSVDNLRTHNHIPINSIIKNINPTNNTIPNVDNSTNIINVILDGHLRITYKIDNRDDLEDIVNYLVAVLKP